MNAYNNMCSVDHHSLSLIQINKKRKKPGWMALSSPPATMKGTLDQEEE